MGHYTETFGATIGMNMTVAYMKVISQHSPGRKEKLRGLIPPAN
jgi:hypothetical protein